MGSSDCNKKTERKKERRAERREESRSAKGGAHAERKTDGIVLQAVCCYATNQLGCLGTIYKPCGLWEIGFEDGQPLLLPHLFSAAYLSQTPYVGRRLESLKE